MNLANAPVKIISFLVLALALPTVTAGCGSAQPAFTPTRTPGSAAPTESVEQASATSTGEHATVPSGGSASYTYPEYAADLPIFTIVSETDTTLTVRDAWGTVEIPKEPRRVFVMDELGLDIMLGIGMKPVGVVGDPSGEMSRFFDGRMDGIEIIPGYEPDFEAILALEPDLIVSMFGWTDDFRDQLEGIAPTLISHPGAFPFWRQATLDLAAVLGRPDEGARLLEEYDAALKSAREELPPGLRDGSESLAVVLIQTDSLRVYGVGFERDGRLYPTNVTQVMYADLRLRPPEFVQDLSLLDPGGGYREVSLELLPQVKSDQLVLISLDPDRSAEIEDNPVFKQVPAVKLGNVYRLPADSTSLGPINMMKRLQEFMEVLRRQ